MAKEKRLKGQLSTKTTQTTKERYRRKYFWQLKDMNKMLFILVILSKQMGENKYTTKSEQFQIQDIYLLHLQVLLECCYI